MYYDICPGNEIGHQSLFVESNYTLLDFYNFHATFLGKLYIVMEFFYLICTSFMAEAPAYFFESYFVHVLFLTVLRDNVR